ncbi:MAG: glycoside hydrolase family 2 TIM barrel-domain containing protein [Bacteroidota bacterium]
MVTARKIFRWGLRLGLAGGSLLLIGVTLLYLWLPKRTTAPSDVLAGGQGVWVEKGPQGYQLMVEDQPFFIQGATGNQSLSRLAQHGGNAFRIYYRERLEERMAQADSLGLGMMVGLGMPAARHGFPYADEAKVDSLIDVLRAVVRSYRDHPALLIWNVGNEITLFHGGDLAVWKAINRVAAMVHEEDPHHPVSYAMGTDYRRFVMARWFCPELDLLSINSFLTLTHPRQKWYSRWLGWQGPYVVSEWGAIGTWQATPTDWNAPLEPSDSTKAHYLREFYTYELPGQRDLCLGTFAFFWGAKQERTHTWYSFFSAEGEKRQTVDQLQFLWNQSLPDNLAPRITQFELAGEEAQRDFYLPAGGSATARLKVRDPEQDSLDVTFELREEGDYRYAYGGDAEKSPAIISRQQGPATTWTFDLPSRKGPYRLFVHVRDGQGNICSQNIPFFLMLTDQHLRPSAD